VGRDSAFGIATRYWLEGPEIIYRWGKVFAFVQTDPGAHAASCTMGTRSFSRGKAAWVWR